MFFVQCNLNIQELRRNIIAGICLAAMVLLVGCMYQEPPPDEVDLLSYLPQSKSSLEVFSYDMGSTVMMPFLNDFGRLPFRDNMLSSGSDLTVTFPFVPMRPQAVTIQMSSDLAVSSASSIRIKLNDADLGVITVQGDGVRKSFTLEKSLWQASVNRLQFSLSPGQSPVLVENVWLTESSRVKASLLNPGNRFTGFAAFPDELSWTEGILLPEGTSLSFPALLPSPSAFFNCSVFSENPDDLKLHIMVETSRALTREQPLQTEVIFKEPDRWFPVKWDISQRSGRYAAITVRNRGHGAVVLKNTLLVAR